MEALEAGTVLRNQQVAGSIPAGGSSLEIDHLEYSPDPSVSFIDRFVSNIVPNLGALHESGDGPQLLNDQAFEVANGQQVC